ncbi:MAG: imidazole glycerol phosphate synthase subunit HisH [Xenococcaceae cyanobacterium]
MKVPEVTVIDYGVGNLLSVQRGLEHCGAKVSITDDPAAIMAAPRVVLPGVGAFGNAMAQLNRLQLIEAIQEVAKGGTPLLGICLGMQLLLEESEEFGLTRGLGLILGRVIPVPNISKTGQPHKIPHIGWNALVLPSNRSNWKNSILQTVEPGESTYFVHSFMANPLDVNHRIADCIYGGVSISAVIGRDHIFGCQFHPEKSGEVGLKILRQFLAL